LRGGKVNFPDSDLSDSGNDTGASGIRQAVADALEAGR